MGGSNSKEKNNKKAASVEEKNLAAEVNNGDQDNVIENIESTQTALVDVNADATCDTMPEGEVTITDNVAQMEDHHKDSINDPDCKTGTSQAVTGAVGKIDNTECCSPETICYGGSLSQNEPVINSETVRTIELAESDKNTEKNIGTDCENGYLSDEQADGDNFTHNECERNDDSRSNDREKVFDGAAEKARLAVSQEYDNLATNSVSVSCSMVQCEAEVAIVEEVNVSEVRSDDSAERNKDHVSLPALASPIPSDIQSTSSDGPMSTESLSSDGNVMQSSTDQQTVALFSDHDCKPLYEQKLDDLPDTTNVCEENPALFLNNQSCTGLKSIELVEDEAIPSNEGNKEISLRSKDEYLNSNVVKTADKQGEISVSLSDVLTQYDGVLVTAAADSEKAKIEAAYNTCNDVVHDVEAAAVSTSSQERCYLQTTEFRWVDAGETVQLCGSFSNWLDRISLTKSGDVHSTTLKLPAGEYLYKYIVDEEWVVSKNQPRRKDDLGRENNVVFVA